MKPIDSVTSGGWASPRRGRGGGKPYLPLHSGEGRLWSTTLVGDLMGIARDMVTKLGSQGHFQTVPVGYRSYVPEDSVKELLKRADRMLLAEVKMAVLGPVVSSGITLK